MKEVWIIIKITMSDDRQTAFEYLKAHDKSVDAAKEQISFNRKWSDDIGEAKQYESERAAWNDMPTLLSWQGVIEIKKIYVVK